MNPPGRSAGQHDAATRRVDGRSVPSKDTETRECGWRDWIPARGATGLYLSDVLVAARLLVVEPGGLGLSEERLNRSAGRLCPRRGRCL